MASEAKYHSTACREMKIDHDTGVLSYSSSDPSVPVAQFIGPKPFSDKFTKFGVVISDQGEKGTAFIGICPEDYSANKKPGFDTQSVGYHAKSGKIYPDNNFWSRAIGEPCVAGDTIECEFFVNASNEKSVKFHKNGKEVYERFITFERSQCFPIVGMQFKGTSVKLLQKEPWTTVRLNETKNSQTDKPYTMSRCNDMTIDQETGVLKYSSINPYIPVGQFIGPRPFSETFTKFSIEIRSRGTRGAITVGICPYTYLERTHPGWAEYSFGYHADNGGIYSESKFLTKGILCSVGDTMECELLVKNQMLTFYRNKEVVYRTKINFQHTACFPMIGMESIGESVKLLEQEPWTQLRSIPIQRNTEEFRYSPSRCDALKISHQTGVLCYAPSTSGFMDVQQGQFVGPRPLSKDFTKFSIEIVSKGEDGGIAVGVCCKDYERGSLPGCSECSFGYHADDGGIFCEGGDPKAITKPCQAGDIMKCKLTNGYLTFKKNGIEVYGAFVNIPASGFYPIVALSSRGECVRLLESDLWTCDADEKNPSCNQFDSYTKDNILISPKDELALTLSAKDQYTTWIIVQNTGLKNILFKVLNEDIAEPASEITPGMTKTINVLFKADEIPDKISVEWLTVEIMDMNSYPSSINSILQKNSKNTEKYIWRVTRGDEQTKTLDVLSGECDQEDHSEDFEMSVETSKKAQVARMPDEWDECNICESKDNIVSKCMECNDILCQICENKHKKGKKSKFHTLLPFAERKNEQEYKKLLFCAVHDFEDFVRFCTKCDTLVCTECMQGDHLGHPFSKIDVIAKDKLKQLETVDQKMADLFSSLSDARTQEYEELVAQRANHFIDLIRANEKKILSELENKKAGGEPLLENCRSSSQIAESAIESYNDIRLLADDTLRDLLIKFADIETPKTLTKEDVDEMFLKDFPSEGMLLQKTY